MRKSLASQLLDFFNKGGSGTNAELAKEFKGYVDDYTLGAIRKAVHTIRDAGYPVTKHFPKSSSRQVVYSLQKHLRDTLVIDRGRPCLPNTRKK